MSSIVEIPLQEILLATKSFAEENLIASGGYGPVYKGESENHGVIAVKRLDPNSSQGDVEFRKEIALLSEYKHQNIVSLLGFCDENYEKILVYKFESNRSLDKHLHKKDLSWIQRLRICLDAARGLKYFHDDVGHVHRDVKSANIQLDENWNAKISNFGLSIRIGHENLQTTDLLISHACGTPGYIDPEYYFTGSLTQESDVYSFGVTLFEVLCGRPTSVGAFKDERQFLTVLVTKHYGRQSLDKIVHSDIQNQIDATSLRTYLTIAYHCLKSGPERPTMNMVVQQLEKALHIQLSTQNPQDGPGSGPYLCFSVVEIPLQEILLATNDFAEENCLASGGYGPVYQGKSEKHGMIAVKRLDPKNGQGDVEFRREIALLSEYKHENIVSLVGFCDESEEKILVYKLESNGSLHKHLHNKDLSWIQRLRICLDAVKGLKYLHDDVGPQQRILHRDVKSANILLGEHWNAKISDFGLSRIAPANMETTLVISNACGTPGYIDPEYFLTGSLTQKSDVYSFGVVLLEVLCGRPIRVTAYKDEREFLTVLVRKHYGRQTMKKIIHFDIQNEIDATSLLTYLNIAYQCLKSSLERPTMNKVVQQLQKALHNQLESSGSWPYDDVYNGLGNYGDDRVDALTKTHGGSLGSSSTHSIPASSSESWKYDVFLSFRGEDARKTFVDHLYYYLSQGMNTNVKVYKDDVTLERGDTIGLSLLNAIQESRIALIIFSKNYVDSSWCLDELAYIMKCKEERGQIVIPIFYNMNPSDVRNQSGQFDKASSYHKSANNNEKVESWRKALIDASSITGLEPKHIANGNEAIAIKEIGSTVLSQLFSVMPTVEASVETNDDADLIGIETRIQELKSVLEVGSGGVRMVSICGVGGSGKTTLASSIYDEISHEFEGCCMINDVQAESRMHGLKKLQEKILSNILKSEVSLESIKQGTSMIKKRLSYNSVLIVLDDVNHIDHLKMLAGSQDWFGDGSRIIITTTNQYLAKANEEIITHNVRMLDDEEAIKLFSRHAFRASRPAKGYKEVSLSMVSKLGGNPLALVTLGSCLHGKDKNEWKNTLAKLGMES